MGTGKIIVINVVTNDEYDEHIGYQLTEKVIIIRSLEF